MTMSCRINELFTRNVCFQMADITRISASLIYQIGHGQIISPSRHCSNKPTDGQRDGQKKIRDYVFIKYSDQA